MDSIDCQTFCIAVVIFGQDGTFVLCVGNAVVEEQVVNVAFPQSICLMCCRWAILHCLQCLNGLGGMMVLLLFICSAGPFMLYMVGVLGWENMTNALCNLGASLSLSIF